MLFYRAALPLSRQTLSFVAGIIRRHRASTGSLWRKLNPGQQALLVLVHLRKGESFAQAVTSRYGSASTHCSKRWQRGRARFSAASSFKSRCGRMTKACRTPSTSTWHSYARSSIPRTKSS